MGNDSKATISNATQVLDDHAVACDWRASNRADGRGSCGTWIHMD